MTALVDQPYDRRWASQTSPGLHQCKDGSGGVAGSCTRTLAEMSAAFCWRAKCCVRAARVAPLAVPAVDQWPGARAEGIKTELVCTCSRALHNPQVLARALMSCSRKQEEGFWGHSLIAREMLPKHRTGRNAGGYKGDTRSMSMPAPATAERPGPKWASTKIPGNARAVVREQ